MMSFSSSNFGGSTQPQLSDYFHGSNHFQKNYGSQQNPAYPLFHPAAMAAMAAAAAGYSQFGTRLTNGPLNLTSVPGYRGAYGFNEPAESMGQYYSGFGLRNGSSYASSYVNGFPSSKNSIQFPFPNTAAFQSLPSTNSDSINHPFVGSTQSSVAQLSSNQMSTSMETQSTPRTSKPHGQKTSCKVRQKKTINAQELACRKRQEFDELVKARTDKLLSTYTPANTEQLSTASCTGLSTGNTPISKDSSSSPNYKKLIEAVLDAKKSALLRSPSVVAYLETQQRSLAEFKRRTEMFCVDVK